MKIIGQLPKQIPVFPLSNFIIFPNTTIPLNIFEQRYIDMIDDSMQSNKIIGLIQPKEQDKETPELYSVGCAAKIKSYKESGDGRYLIVLSGINRFKISKELINDKTYRECEVSFDEYNFDQNKNTLKFNRAELGPIFKNLKSLFKRKGYVINLDNLEKGSLEQIINTLIMASPFSLEEKQALLETPDTFKRKAELEKILNTYIVDNFSNTTLQ
jgi:Lon protease-like protein|tara:strand:- start:1465 stop:2106 length:642 start_codon:yes stop_codon:yes gene_type:complete